MKRLPLLSLLYILNLSSLFSQEKNFKSEFGFRSDNDSFLGYGQDRYYTNGLFISFRQAMKQDTLRKRLAKKIWAVEAGQYMFNSYTGQINDISEFDRPFAAYLFGGAKLTWILKDEQTFELALNAGTIGPNAYGKNVQEGLHKAIGFYPVKGWEYQVNNEIGINSSFNYSRLLSRKQNTYDFSLSSYANLGNTFAGAGTGILFRAGSFNKFFSSVSNNSRVSNSTSDSIPKKEFFFFTRPMLHFIAYDATVQGGLFSDNKGEVVFDPNRIQYSQELGINYAVNHWTLNFSVIFKSRDVKTQDRPHQYGSASIFYRF